MNYNKLLVFWFWLLVALCLSATSSVAQSDTRVDSLPADGVNLLSGWRWHPGDNPAWASPAFGDRRWDTIRPNRSITRLPAFEKSPQGWFRLAFRLDSGVAQQPLAVVISQTGASEWYLDGHPFLQLGKVGADYDQQETYLPAARDSWLLPKLSAGRHVLAVRLSQHSPPWYRLKVLYFTQAVFTITLFPANTLTGRITNQVYVQTLGNYLLIGAFLLLGVIHFMYYRYRPKRVNLLFGLTMLSGTCCVLLIEGVGLVNTLSVAEGLFFSQGICVALFMWLLLVTYYVYLDQPVGWFLAFVAILLLIPRIVSEFTAPFTAINILSLVATLLLFGDGIRISLLGIRAKRANARFMFNSILILVLILIVGGITIGWLSSQYPVYSEYVSAVTNMLFFLTLPVSFAIILAREYAQTNSSLEARLTEIAQLSQEKESILTQQNETLERQVSERTTELTKSLTELRDTQQQLIQREKLASLGELTAGIAHEIQNPLNFVNNFAEVSSELILELKEEREQETPDQELETEILADLEQNMQRINHHGGRASSIVRSMLEHSRTSTGQRELTDLNALADEYLRLSYHGFRRSDDPRSDDPRSGDPRSGDPAKDKVGLVDPFNTQLITHFDPTARPIPVVTQDIGRVLLNLFNNAFYALHERQRTVQGGEPYKPAVTVSTHQSTNGIDIRVSDNGTGVPDAVREKIFQPFFTTKPTGQGTGLGLSLSYDIITKGHGGTFTLETNTGEGTSFVIHLPMTNDK